MKNFLLIVYFSCILIVTNKAQQQNLLPTIIPTTPNSTELGHFGAVPVGLFTGTAQLNIPLFELKTKNLSVPISLNYSSNGLKVDKVSSWVGMDWSLESGGVINRIVKGDPDDIKPLVNYPEGLKDSLKWLQFVKNNSPNNTENDIYIYTLPGASGKFVFDYTGKSITIPSEKLRISKNNNYTSISITKPDGTQYVFSAVEYSKCLDGGASCGYIQIPTSWYLTQIVHPSKETIKFYYSNPYNIEYYSGIYQAVTAFVTSSCPPYCFFDPSATEREHNAQGIGARSETFHLDSIVAEGYGKISFKATKNRLDLESDYKLDEIKIFNNRRDLLKTIEFNYKYPKSLVNYQNEFYGNLVGYNIDELKYRLFLSKIKVINSDKTDSLKYIFDYYNLDTLPPRLSFSQDHWGYFNGRQTNNCLFPTNDVNIQTNLRLAEIISRNNYNCSREPDGRYSMHGMLKKIIYPTGGYTIIEYEPNIADGKEYGGCRVLRTQDYSNEGANPYIKKYYYNNYLSINRAKGTDHSKLSYFKRYGLGEQNCQMPQTNIIYFVPVFEAEVSNSLFSLYSNGNFHITYPTVTISYGNNFENGGEEHSFLDKKDEDAVKINMVGGLISPVPQSNSGWKTGTKLIERYLRKDSLGVLNVVKEVFYNYNLNEQRNRNVIKCLAFQYARSLPQGIITKEESYAFCYDVMEYFIYSEWMTLQSKITKNYEGDNYVTEKEIYQYENPRHQLLTRQTFLKSNGKPLIKKYKYAGDYAFSVDTSCLDSYIGCKNTATNQYNYAIGQCNSDSITCTNNCYSLGDPQVINTCLFSCRRTSCRKNAFTNFITDTTLCHNSMVNCLGLNTDNKPIYYLQSTYQISTPIEEQTLGIPNDSIKLISGKFTKFRVTNEGLILPDSIFALQTQLPSSDTIFSSLVNNRLLKYHNRYLPEAKFDRYDFNGNPLEYHKINDIKTSYYWGYSNTLPIIKADNVSYDILNSAVLSSESNLMKLLNDIGDLTTDESKILWKNFNTKLSQHLPANAFVTTYTYKPQVGITSQTDVNGTATYYEYDKFNRLTLIKDKDFNILKKFDYHYKN